jgi:hypothetical protein
LVFDAHGEAGRVVLAEVRSAPHIEIDPLRVGPGSPLKAVLRADEFPEWERGNHVALLRDGNHGEDEFPDQSRRAVLLDRPGEWNVHVQIPSGGVVVLPDRSVF